MNIIRRHQWTEQAWKNGRGVTREIFRSPVEGEFDWRISMADLRDSGAFSQFPGIDRHLLLWEGEAVELHWPDRSLKLNPGEVVQFSGDEPCSANVVAPSTDLNVMVKRDVYSATVVVHSGRIQNTKMGTWNAIIAYGSTVIVGGVVLDSGDMCYGSQLDAPVEGSSWIHIRIDRK